MKSLIFNRILIFASLFSMLTMACGKNIPVSALISGKAVIYPDYSDVTLPVNIAPLNFNITGQAEKYRVYFHGNGGGEFMIRSCNGKIRIPPEKWKEILSACINSSISINIYYRKDGQWYAYETIVNQVSADSIDSYLAYRLIEPGFETWNRMGIYQRNLGNFDERPVMINELSDGNCMNCHSFSANSSKSMLFHVRAQHGGTIILRNGKITKVDTRTDSTLSAGVYPAWHPDGRYAVFSVNNIVQSFHALPGKKVEVIDTLSDLILYDAETNCVIKCNSLSVPGRFETFPNWSPDGSFLYYCSTAQSNYHDYQQMRYDLLKVSFNAATATFGIPDTVIPAARNGYSLSFPRVSPDGRYVLLCKTAYGNFTIWHKDADLVLLDLKTGELIVPDINSRQSESYHTWSSTGCWIVFSSRREDGLYTRLYFSYFDKSGHFHKPFILPQRDPEYNVGLLKSYNVPELVTSRIPLNPRMLSRVIRSEAVKATFKKSE